MPLPSIDDPVRLQRLHESALLDRPREDAYDAVTRLVCRTLDVSCSLMTLIDEGRQWFVSSHGLDEPWSSRRQTPLSHSLCQYVVQFDAPLVIPDTRVHPLVRHSLAVTELRAVAYIGVPLRAADGTVLGSLAALHAEPRAWEADDVELLAGFATLAMAELRSRDERLRREQVAAQHEALLRQVPVAVVAAEPGSGRVLYWNERAEALWGEALFDGEPALARAAGRASDGRALRRDELPLARVLAGAEVATLEYQVERPDGARWAFERAFVVRDAVGRPLQCVSLAEDVTEQRRGQDALRQSQRLESVGLLAGGIAHDFNNILTVVLSNCDLALGALAADHPAYADVVEIRDAGERAAALTRQLLAFSRAQSLQTAPLDVSAVVRDASRMVERLLDVRITLRFVLAERLPPVLADRGQLEQVLVNLVVNARDAMPSGGAVVVETGERALHEGDVAGLPPGAYVSIAVRDTGAGMDRETMARVFEPFFTTKDLGKGTGLGLSTVHGIAHQLGGAVTVTSAPGTGAAFTVLLPVATAVPRATP